MRALTNSRHPILATCVALAAVALLSAGCSGGGGSSGGGSAAGSGANTGSSGGGNTGSPFIPTGNGLDGETAFSQTVYPIVDQYCTGCHAGAGPGFPHIAHPDLGTAYRAVIDNQKANFANPNASRLVQRLVTDQHFCWSDCAADGMTMETAIQDWANLIGYDPGGGNNGGNTGSGGTPVNGVISSFANTFANATVASSQRYETNIIALYTFDEEQGTTTMDLSGVPPAMDLTLDGVAWVPGGGIEIVDGIAIAEATTSEKLFDRIASGRGSQEYSVEAWVIPANTDQTGPARIVTYSSGTQNRNFTVGQVQYNYVFRNRSMAAGIGPNGTPALQTPDAEEDLQATLQHVVMTFDQANGRRIYVNGVWTGDEDRFDGGPLINWNPTYRFALGNETTRNRLWLGQLRMVAVFDRALTDAQVQQNYLAGSSDKYTLRFGLDDWLMAGDYIELEVSDFDAYSYLFCFPTIESGMAVTGFPVERLRVAVNGVPPVASQSFQNISATVSQSGQVLSGLCSVVPKDLGSQLDQFAIWFDVLAGADVRVPEPPPTIVPDLSVNPPMPNTAVRDFDRINNTLAEITGVDPNNAAVRATFDGLRTQLPMDSDVRSFVSAHQVGISKLALEYCDQLVESAALRAAFFGTFNFAQNSVAAFAAQADRDLIINALFDQAIGMNLVNQPTQPEVAAVINALIDDLTMGCTPATCPAERTETVVKGACAAVVGSAAVHLD